MQMKDNDKREKGEEGIENKTIEGREKEEEKREKCYQQKYMEGKIPLAAVWTFLSATKYNF